MICVSELAIVAVVEVEDEVELVEAMEAQLLYLEEKNLEENLKEKIFS